MYLVSSEYLSSAHEGDVHILSSAQVLADNKECQHFHSKQKLRHHLFHTRATYISIFCVTMSTMPLIKSQTAIFRDKSNHRCSRLSLLINLLNLPSPNGCHDKRHLRAENTVFFWSFSKLVMMSVVEGPMIIIIITIIIIIIIIIISSPATPCSCTGCCDQCSRL